MAGKHLIQIFFINCQLVDSVGNINKKDFRLFRNLRNRFVFYVGHNIQLLKVTFQVVFEVRQCYRPDPIDSSRKSFILLGCSRK